MRLETPCRRASLMVLIAAAIVATRLGAQAPASIPPDLAALAQGTLARVCGQALPLGCDSPEPTATLTFRTLSSAPVFSVVVPVELHQAIGLNVAAWRELRQVCVTGRIESGNAGYLVKVSQSDQLIVRPPLTTEQQAERQPETLYRVCDRGVTPPKLVNQVEPRYTPGASPADQKRGVVLLQGAVGVDGKVREVQVLRPLDGGELDRSAVGAFEQWSFEPGRHGGRPVTVLVTVKMTLAPAD